MRPGAFLGTIPADVPGEYWLDPVAHGNRLVPLTPFAACHRFCLGDVTVPFIDRVDCGLPLYGLLAQGPVSAERSRPCHGGLALRLLDAGLAEAID